MSSSELDSVRHYLNQIGRFPLLKVEEEIECGRLVQEYVSLKGLKEKQEEALKRSLTNVEWAALAQISEAELQSKVALGIKAKRRMYEGNLRLVVNVAKKYSCYEMELLDLIQEGNLGLERGIDLFDPDKGYKFSTYAYWWIRQAITRAISDKSRTVRLPVHIVENRAKLVAASHRLQLQLNRNPTIQELSGEAEMSVRVALNCLEASRVRTVSLSLPTGEDENNCLENLIAAPSASPSNSLADNNRRDLVFQLLEALDPEKRQIVIHRFGLGGEKGKTALETATVLGLPYTKVKHEYRNALNHLKSLCRQNPTFASLRDLISS